MSISLQKGQKVSLSKDGANLNRVTIGLGWDVASSGSGKGGLFAKAKEKIKTVAIDCDASAILLTNGRLTADDDVVYFGRRNHKSGAVIHMGDNLTGAGDGDDEQIVVELNSIPQQYDKIVFVVNIYQARSRKQHFGMIQNAFIRIVDGNNRELCKYNLSDDYNNMTAMIFGEVYRHNGEWKFNALGQGTSDLSVKALSARYR